MLLSPLRVSLTNAALTYVKLTKDLEAHGISLSQAIEEYKLLAKLKERSARLDFAIDKYCYTLLKKELSSEYVTGVERTLARFMGDFGKERIVSLITGREIFQWLINLKKREYGDSNGVAQNRKDSRKLGEMARAVRLGSGHKEKDSYKAKSSSTKKASREPRQRQLDKKWPAPFSGDLLPRADQRMHTLPPSKWDTP